MNQIESMKEVEEGRGGGGFKHHSLLFVNYKNYIFLLVKVLENHKIFF